MVLVCMSVALAMPAMEVAPFSANGGGLALIARDGLLALFAATVTPGTFWFVISGFMR
ncbi:MAG: hypothetical protein R6W86_05700 [Marinobacter sp.]|uniref:hypothetical protein n=1 Tax=Marinobacter sp. TaxID=50741 RepID=UPI00396DE89E